MRERLQRLLQWMGRAGVAFVVTFVAWLLLTLTGSMTFLRIVFLIGTIVTGAWLMLRWLRWLAEKAVWRLRHRLIVTYLFIAVAPVFLLAGIAALTAYSLLLQVAMNAVTTELEHRETELGTVAQQIAENHSLGTLEPFFTSRYPGISAVLHENGREARFPSRAEVPPPVQGFQRMVTKIWRF